MWLVDGYIWLVVGIVSGGVWIVKWLVYDFGLFEYGVVNVVMYCDDYVKKGLYVKV